MSEEATPAVPPPPKIEDPQRDEFTKLRDHANGLETDLKALKDSFAELKSENEALKQAQMTDEERKAAEHKALQEKAAEADRLRDEAGKYTSQFEQLYKDQLSKVPEALREKAEAASQYGTWADRVSALNSALAMIGEAPAIQVGTITNPRGAGEPGPQNFDLKNIPEVKLKGAQ